MKNKHAVALGRIGGKVKSDKKSIAAKNNAILRWKKVREKKIKKVVDDAKRLV